MTKPFVSASSFSAQGVDAKIAFGLVTILMGATWLPHLPDSLWLDETLTYWVVKDGLAETLERAVHYQSQSAYYLFIWFWTQLAGTSEIALRMPSLLAAIGGCVALAKLGTSLTRDRETGLLTMIVFASTWNVFRESVDARSYMPGLFVLLCLALCVVRWLDKGNWREAWLCGVLAAVLPHLHLFFVLTYPAFVLYAALRWPRARGEIKQIGLIGLLLLVGAVLFLPAAQTLVTNGSTYSFAPLPRWGSLFQTFVWAPPVTGLLVGLCAAGVIGAKQVHQGDEANGRSEPIARDVGILLAIWLLTPLLILFFVSRHTEMSVFLGRFLISTTPAACLLYAIALRGIPGARARIIAVLIIALASFVTHVRPDDDFRGAVQSVNQFVAGNTSTPILFASGLIEGQHESWLRNPSHAEYLKAPTTYYPLDGRVVTVPRKLYGQPIGNEIVNPILRTGERFAAIEWAGNGANILGWLIRRAEGAGYRTERRAFSGVRVAVFSPSGKRRGD